MATTYTGSATATESGDTAPAPEKVPVINVPTAGDLLTVSSVLSAFKSLANHVSFLLFPKAKSTDWVKSILNFYSALGHKRHRIDHMGFPAGQIQHWRESWGAGGVGGGGGGAGIVGPTGTFGPVDLAAPAFTDVAAALNDLSTNLGVAAVAANLGAVQSALGSCAGNALAATSALSVVQGLTRWRVKTKKTTGTSSVGRIHADALSDSLHSYITLQCGDTSGDYVSLFSTTDVSFTDDANWYVEWPLKLSAADLVKLTAFVGVALEGGVPPFDGSPPVHYAGFSLAPGGGNWQYSNRGGGSAVSASTGVAASTNRVRMRVEMHGATVADNTTRAIRFYINGALVGTITADIPGSSNQVSLHFSLQNTTGGAHGLSNPLNIGPVAFSSNLFPSDVL
jgi:hypothetical protein